MKPFSLIPLFLMLAACGLRREPLPVYGEIPRFALTAQSGERFDSSRLDGKPWVANFMFTSCNGPCPRLSRIMAQVQRGVKEVPGVTLVSFTVDPEHDTPSVLAEYAKRYKAEPGRWYFLTGDRKTLDMLDYQAFKLGHVDGSFEHSTRLVLVDGRGRVRRYYDTDTASQVGSLVEDLKSVLKEGL